MASIFDEIIFGPIVALMLLTIGLFTQDFSGYMGTDLIYAIVVIMCRIISVTV